MPFVRPHQVIDEEMGIVRVLRISRDEQSIDPEHRTLTRHRVGEVHIRTHFFGPRHRLRIVAGPAHRDTDFLVRKVVDHLRGAEIADIRAHRFKLRLDLGDMCRIHAVVIMTEIQHGQRYDVGWLV